ncbi:hypothetical protein LTR04_000684, partial [Oleoguttula sp. CCFEE 6159]
MSIETSQFALREVGTPSDDELELSELPSEPLSTGKRPADDDLSEPDPKLGVTRKGSALQTALVGTSINVIIFESLKIPGLFSKLQIRQYKGYLLGREVFKQAKTLSKKGISKRPSTKLPSKKPLSSLSPATISLI